MASGGTRAYVDAVRRDGWVRPFLAKHGLVLAAAVVLSVLASLFASALMFTSGYMISLAAAIPFTVLALHVPSIFVRIFGIGKPVLQYFERLASHDWVLRMTSSLRMRLYVAVERRPRARSVGAALGLFADDLEHLQNLCLRTIFPMISIVAVYVIVVVVFGALSPLMGLLMLVVVGIAAFAMPFWSLAVNGAREERARSLASRMYDGLSEDVAGATDWGLSGRKTDFETRAEALYEETYALRRERDSFERVLSIVRQVIYCLVVVCVLVWAAYAFGGTEGASPDGFTSTGLAGAIAHVTMHDSVPLAANWIAAFVLCMFPLLDVFSPADAAVLGLAEHKRALDDLNGLDAEPVDEDAPVGGATARGATNGVASQGDAANESAREVTVSGNPMEPGVAIALDKATFAYDGASLPAVADVTLSVRRGEHVAVMGRSGAGKSTLLALMAGSVAPTSGRAVHAGKVGHIEQFPYVFRKSLRENLLLAKPDASEEEIIDALRRVRLGGLLDRLPQGLDTLMAEGGATLSGGERHRLALARILLYDCDIVLLDEPYLGLDEDTWRAVSDTMLEELAGRTIVMVTHSSAQAACMDVVYRVESGRIVPVG